MDNKCNYGKTGSCKKGKRSISDKPKQPQRGLGVAQLEKIRMQNEIMANYIPSCQPPYQNGFEIGYVDASRRDSLYGGSHQRTAIRSSVHGEAVSFSHNVIGQQNEALPLFAQSLEDSMQWKTNYNYQASSMYYHCYQDSSKENQEVDLELRLAL
ncbi:protein SPEAR1-like [Carex rostrata]